ncbi:MAG: hypothetical protein JXA68_12365 [Ignavibacteriales bacterium]|nr:hypothetical protein [Ignavibacteriales bacterium]
MKRSISLAVALLIFTIFTFPNVLAQDNTQNRFKNKNENVVKNQNEEKKVNFRFQSQEKNQLNKQENAKFVDANADGINDNYQTKKQDGLLVREQVRNNEGQGNKFGQTDLQMSKGAMNGLCDGLGSKGAGYKKGGN